VRQKENKTPTLDRGKKTSTTDLPMFDLGQIVSFVNDIRQKGLETTGLAEVAKQTGYAAPTSTPFYRRLVAARLFKLLAPQGAELTKLALDYLKPDSEEAKAAALAEAIYSVPTYVELMDKHVGKKLNFEMLANGIARSSGLADSCAQICARAFIVSVKFAGLLTGDDTLTRGPDKRTNRLLTNQSATVMGNPLVVASAMQGGAELETYYLTLDARTKRRVVVQAPPAVTAQELKRVQEWLSFQLLVTEAEAAQLGDSPTPSNDEKSES
jgi:hypothetical protein